VRVVVRCAVGEGEKKEHSTLLFLHFDLRPRVAVGLQGCIAGGFIAGGCIAGGCMVVLRRDRCGLREMLTWQSAEVVTEVDCSTKLQRVLSWVSDTGRTHW